MEQERHSILAKAPRGEWLPSPPTWAEISWRESGAPYSERYGDVFFSGSGALEESEWVFFKGGGLDQRDRRNQGLCIAELGFGAGLNFINTWDLLRRSSFTAPLHYVAFEKHPWHTADLERLYSSWPHLRPLFTKLLDSFPPLIAGFHAISWPEENTRLTLCLGDLAEFLPHLEAKVDVWYLDGFSPSKNPQMWSDEVCEAMAKCSVSGARLATYSVARSLRDSLTRAGFSVVIAEGFGRKRQMLTARYIGAECALPFGETRQSAFSSPVRSGSPRGSQVFDLAIIGAGLAGCALAYSFLQRGSRVLLVDEASGIANRASGNKAAVFMPYLSVKPDFLSRFNTAGYLALLRVIRRFREQGKPIIGENCGVLRLATSGRLQTLCQSLESLSLPSDFARAVTAEEGARLCGVPVNKPGLWFSNAGWLWPESLCRALLLSDQGEVELKCDVKVSHLERENNWRLLDKSGNAIAEAAIVVLANAYQARELKMLRHLPLEQVRGQVSSLSESEQTKRLCAVLCYDGYLTPAKQGSHLLGATFEHDNFSFEVSPAQEEELLSRLASHLENSNLQSSLVTGSRVSFRTMSPDRLPLIGSAPQVEGFVEAYKKASNGNFGPNYPTESAFPDLYLSLGHGSRGLLSCLLAGEIIAARVFGEPMPLESDLLRAVDPQRFLVRAVRRGEELGRDL